MEQKVHFIRVIQAIEVTFCECVSGTSKVAIWSVRFLKINQTWLFFI